MKVKFCFILVIVNGSVMILNNVFWLEVRIILDLFINNFWLVICILFLINLFGLYIYIKIVGKYKGYCLFFFKEL